VPPRSMPTPASRVERPSRRVTSPPSSTPIRPDGSLGSERGEESRCRAARVLHSRGSAQAPWFIVNRSLSSAERAATPLVDAKSVGRAPDRRSRDR
jgi:hypothetical protein